MLATMLFYTVLGFFSGSILYSYLLPKFLCHIDICALSEDHNPGAFNAFRLCGPLIGFIAVFLDVFKAACPVYLALTRGHLWGWLILLPALSPVLGHAYSPLRRFHGGKAIAAFFGVLVGLLPVTPLLWCFVACILPLTPFFRDHSLLMCVSTSLFSCASFVLFADPPIKAIALVLSAIVFSRHRAQATQALIQLRSARHSRLF